MVGALEDITFWNDLTTHVIEIKFTSKCSNAVLKLNMRTHVIKKRRHAWIPGRLSKVVYQGRKIDFRVYFFLISYIVSFDFMFSLFYFCSFVFFCIICLSFFFASYTLKDVSNFHFLIISLSFFFVLFLFSFVNSHFFFLVQFLFFSIFLLF